MGISGFQLPTGQEKKRFPKWEEAWSDFFEILSSRDSDWFFAKLSGPNQDRLKDPTAGAAVTGL
jgi:hypothetical protein